MNLDFQPITGLLSLFRYFIYILYFIIIILFTTFIILIIFTIFFCFFAYFFPISYCNKLHLVVVVAKGRPMWDHQDDNYCIEGMEYWILKKKRALLNPFSETHAYSPNQGVIESKSGF